MKYRVVGWSYYDDMEFEYKEGATYTERNAIIDEIRRKGYKFTGFDHQETFDCAPVLNDGKMRNFSQRSWGGIMAEAHGYTGKFDYSYFTYPPLGAESVFPHDTTDWSAFVPETDLNEEITVTVDEPFFRRAIARNPFPLPDANELRYLDSGDTLTLVCGDGRVSFKVRDLERTEVKGNTKNKYGYKFSSDRKIIIYRERMHKK